MITESLTYRSDNNVIVLTPEPAILKVMVSVPELLLAALIAARRLPAPLSLVLVTIVEAGKLTFAKKISLAALVSPETRFVAPEANTT